MNFLKKILILALFPILILAGKYMFDEYTNNIPQDTIKGTSSSWLYRKLIQIPNETEEEVLNKDVLLTIDTEELISSGKLLSNCNDIRFLAEDFETPLRYWVEQGCNTQETKIWVRIPNLKSDGSVIYFIYGNNDAINLEDPF